MLLIVYGSLYPWTFETRELTESPLYILLHSWDLSFENRRFLFDIAVNVALYVPLGMSGYLAMRRFPSRALAVVSPIVLGTLLSAAMEMIQIYTPQRVCSAVDLVNNILGSAIGVIAGIVFQRIVNPASYQVRDRSAVVLLSCWVSSLLFPFFPVLWLAIWRAKLSAFLHGPVFGPVSILLGAAEWFAVGRLLAAAGARSPSGWLFVAILLVPIQFGIVSHDPMPSDFVAAALAAALFYFFGKQRASDGVAAIALLAAVALRGLTPFHFEGAAHEFLWTPFVGLLGVEWQRAIPVFLGKLFQYGASIWLLNRSGLGLLRATATVTLILAGIEVMQTRIPGHVPEITDPLLAVLMGLGFRSLSLWQIQGRDVRPTAS